MGRNEFFGAFLRDDEAVGEIRSDGQAGVLYFDDKTGAGVLQDVYALTWDKTHGFEFIACRLRRAAGHQPILATYLDIIERHVQPRVPPEKSG
jgi:hypothetical protein